MSCTRQLQLYSVDDQTYQDFIDNPIDNYRLLNGRIPDDIRSKLRSHLNVKINMNILDALLKSGTMRDIFNVVATPFGFPLSSIQLQRLSAINSDISPGQRALMPGLSKILEDIKLLNTQEIYQYLLDNYSIIRHTPFYNYLISINTDPRSFTTSGYLWMDLKCSMIPLLYYLISVGRRDIASYIARQFSPVNRTNKITSNLVNQQVDVLIDRIYGDISYLQLVNHSQVNPNIFEATIKRLRVELITSLRQTGTPIDYIREVSPIFELGGDIKDIPHGPLTLDINQGIPRVSRVNYKMKYTEAKSQEHYDAIINSAIGEFLAIESKLLSNTPIETIMEDITRDMNVLNYFI